jgi:hypothetical protein
MANSKEAKGKDVRHIDTTFDPVAAALKQLHDSVAEEALPSDFLRILEEIDAKIAAAKSAP